MYSIRNFLGALFCSLAMLTANAQTDGFNYQAVVRNSQGELVSNTNVTLSIKGIAKITINRPRYRNAFTPKTTWELSQAFTLCREMQDISVVILTGIGDKAFCSGGDMHVKGRGGYIDEAGVPRLSVLDVQMQIRRLPKPVIAMVNGYAIGGGHVLHLVCDLTIASENAIFGQTGPKVGSFDAGFGASYLARIVGQKKAREIWFLCRQYSAQEAERMGLVNKVVPFERLEDECILSMAYFLYIIGLILSIHLQKAKDAKTCAPNHISHSIIPIAVGTSFNPSIIRGLSSPSSECRVSLSAGR